MVALSLSAPDRRTVLTAAGATTAVLGGAWLLKRALRQTKTYPGPYVPGTLPKDAYDVIIVGAGEFARLGPARWQRCRVVSLLYPAGSRDTMRSIRVPMEF